MNFRKKVKNISIFLTQRIKALYNGIATFKIKGLNYKNKIA